ncbi:uncharacterized protein YciI [Paraburkholderia tropica]|uniref:YciI family protein n=1 Tax=Paraburkholderia tropica TaxID=92647 RepID=UPI001618DB4C|nr:YciI family protein [Paraburkholderia tropica]MBB3003990.1 uncharacterized protein YciI [Paraburkholderia tropica]MBB6323414.1 uncharacterized protein YciI [Paraburkholderia tropica]
MIYIVELTYVRPLDEVMAQLDGHKQWLVSNVREGNVLVAGPLVSKTGGIVVATATSEEELHAMMAQDSFVKEAVAEYRVLAFEPGLVGDLFPREWASQAKVIERQ